MEKYQIKKWRSYISGWQMRHHEAKKQRSNLSTNWLWVVKCTCIRAHNISTLAWVTPALLRFRAFTTFKPNFSRNLEEKINQLTFRKLITVLAETKLLILKQFLDFQVVFGLFRQKQILKICNLWITKRKWNFVACQLLINE